MSAENIYDFDGTIYNGDSTLDFLLFSLKKHPGLIRFLPGQIWAIARQALLRTGKTAMKERVYRSFQGYDVQALLPEFWQTHSRKVAGWYLAQKDSRDIVISASPEFLLEPICRQLGIGTLIASRVDCHTGRYTGENCRGAEKVNRLAALGIHGCKRFYSDSLSDAPVALLAEEAYRIKKDGAIAPWPNRERSGKNG